MVPSRTMFLIDVHYALLMSNKISCDDFVSKLRSVAGNNVMESAIYNIQSKEMTSKDQKKEAPEPRSVRLSEPVTESNRSVRLQARLQFAHDKAQFA
ncbi:RCD1-SRO-TAF4 (RST) plant domain protein [Medicago truncatula]|uniref:RCD1-SRO-TAF4 (RST) plant domain protein n=1 Tax=Medicago truncatula TaxID=3880 RepID=A0A072TZQ5_MEDTR|nr:RCD1-SRO-TAF4 (RST) plant domain protein [Medicago truncatula]